MNIDFPTPEQIPALKELWKAAFGDEEDFLRPFFKIAYAPERCRCITLEGQVAAALYWFDCTCGDQKLVYIYAVATHPSFRGRGLCKALMDDTAALLKQQGYDGILLYPASETLSRMYEKMGYHRCTHIREFECDAAGTSAVLRPVGKSEYARLRRQLLPPGSVIQEGPLLDFLAEQGRFYAGDGWVAAVSADSAELTCHEILGNISIAPEILCALGAQKGHFRAPGSEIPFAMALPLTENYTDPSHFAFALD